MSRGADGSEGSPPARKPRSDALRNRALVLATARAAFEAEGVGVPVHEIARRAGVGPGTVTRHFPTKNDLVSALVRECVDKLTEAAAATEDPARPADSFFALVAALLDETAANAGLNQALTTAGVDVNAAFPDAQRAILDLLGVRLARVQRDGSVRPDVDAEDVAALVVGSASRLHGGDREAARGRLLAVLRAGLAPTR